MRKEIEANVKIIDKMLEEYEVEAAQEAKEAIINFAVLFGEKLVRTCLSSKSYSKKITS